MAASAARRSWTGRIGGAIVSFAVAIVLLGIAAIPFANPLWIHTEQDRVGAATLTGYSQGDLRAATDGILHDLALGGGFDVSVAGAPVLDAAERSHMVDVRGAFSGFAGALVLSVVVVLVAGFLARTAAARAELWLAVRSGANSLAILLGVIGVAAVFAFDAAFEVFHEILFPGGNFNFDPRTEKMVQLFPERFWSETALAYGAVAIVLALAVAWYARRRSAAGAHAADALSARATTEASREGGA